MNCYERTLTNGIGYLRHEIRYLNRPLIVDTRMIDGKYETIAMRRNGKALYFLYSDSPALAADNHAKMIRHCIPVYLRSFSDDLTACLTQAREEFGKSEDGGTSNFDSPAIRFPGAHAGTVEAAASLVGENCSRWNNRRNQPFYDFFVFSGPTGQGNRRTRIAERTTELLKERGYDTTVCYRMD